MGKMIEYTYPLNLLEEFSNAIDVIKYINKNGFDLRFLDIHVPDFLETIKIILVTSDKNFTIEAPKYECIVYYLVKPITEDRFQKAIQKANSVSSSATRIVNNRRYCKRILH